jgi:hypothetical protein
VGGYLGQQGRHELFRRTGAATGFEDSFGSELTPAGVPGLRDAVGVEKETIVDGERDSAG